MTMKDRSQAFLVTFAAVLIVSVILVAAGAPPLVVVPATLLVTLPAVLTYAWLVRASVEPEMRLRGASLAAGGFGALLAGCYGWHPIACAGVGGVAMLITAYVLDDRERRLRIERDR